MSFFDEIRKNRDLTEKITKERNKVKNALEEKLNSIGFNIKEIDAVMRIVDIAEAKIEVVKVSLEGTNINTVGDPMHGLNMGIIEIKKIQTQMAIDIKNKIDEIKKRKGI